MLAVVWSYSQTGYVECEAILLTNVQRFSVRKLKIWL
jgi:hypothetical protein